MQEIKHISCIYHTILFSFPNEGRLNSAHYFIIKIDNKRKLQNIATNHSADIDYKDFIKIYNKRAIEPYSFMTFDTTLPTNNSLKFLKKSFRSILNMKLIDELKILDDMIKANQAQYDLDGETAKNSPLSSKELGKYEYSTVEVLGYKPGVVEKTNFEYS